MSRIKLYFGNLLCLDEKRVSIIVLVFLAFTIVGMYLLFKTHDIPDNLTDLLIWFGGFIIGYNGLQEVRNITKG